jgi:hypothetical protein
LTAIACTRGDGIGASASSTISTIARAAGGTPLHCSGGEQPAPSAV